MKHSEVWINLVNQVCIVHLDELVQKMIRWFIWLISYHFVCINI